jgi:hypothetical protein
VILAALVTLDNKDTATIVTTGSQATFGSQSFTPSVAGPGLTPLLLLLNNGSLQFLQRAVRIRVIGKPLSFY